MLGQKNCVACYIMSYGNSGSGRTFGEKSPKKRKQEFHRHKIKFTESKTLEFSSLKERTLVALAHLGEQRFSEDGVYAFENWMKSFNFLLDEFEEGAGRDLLSREYYATRLEVNSSLTHSAEPGGRLDEELSRLREEELKVRNALVFANEQRKIALDREERLEKIKALEEEKSHVLELLEKSKSALYQKQKELQDSGKFFRRIFAGSKSKDANSLVVLQQRVSDYALRVETVEKKLHEQKKKLEYSENKMAWPLEQRNQDPKELQTQLDSINLKLQELQSQKAEASQLLDQRKWATESMREVISRIEPLNVVASD